MSELALAKVPTVGIMAYPSAHEIETMRDFAKYLISARLVPESMDKPEKILLALEAGRELGLGPMATIQNSYIINGRVTFMVNVLMSLIYRSGKLKKMRITEGEGFCEVYMARRDTDVEYTARWDERQAKEAGLMGKGTWGKFKVDMLKSRAITRCARAVFNDVVNGIYAPDELGAELAYDADGEARVVTVVQEEPTAQPEPQAEAAPEVIEGEFEPQAENPFEGPPERPAARLEEPPEPEPEAGFDGDGKPVSTRGWELQAEEAIEQGTLDPAHAQAISNAGALRGFLMRQCGLGMTQQDDFKGLAGYPEVTWASLTQPQLLVILWHVLKSM
ncbi:MAG: recombinase family protein [Armatimonadota bacterium]